MGRDISFTLVSYVKTKDSTGQMIPSGKPVESSCIGTLKSVSQNEFFKAAQVGFQSEGVIEMNIADYNGQKTILIGGDKFTIYRTYAREDDWIELYYGERVGD